MLAALYPTKKALKESKGKPFRYEETSLFGAEYAEGKTLYVVGPSAHQRKWFAQVVCRNGLVESVK